MLVALRVKERLKLNLASALHGNVDSEEIFDAWLVLAAAAVFEADRGVGELVEPRSTTHPSQFTE